MTKKDRLLQIVRKAICGLLPLCVANVVAERVAEEIMHDYPELLRERTEEDREFIDCVCPNCNHSNTMRKVHILSARLPFWWYIECWNCHWCGKTKLFLNRAVRSWKKEVRTQWKGEVRGARKVINRIMAAKAIGEEKRAK